MTFEKMIRRFQGADRNTRLETLLDYARRLPDPPARLTDSLDRNAHRVHECQTPVFLWVETEGERVHLWAEVPRESPTVRGFVSLLATGLAECTPEEAAALPSDLIDQLRLTETLGMMRMQGLSAVLGRVKRMAGELQ